ncbi:MAG: SDR family oxidoreductase [Rhizobiaceae bacterium]|nr:SDR family oxidoreductase [Rhizobiaceae bacterium]
MAGRMAGKKVLLTGGATGIGRATAELLVSEGARIVIADINVAEGENLAERLGPAARFQRCDVTEEDDIRATIDAAVAFLGGLDILVNNAGMITHKPIAEMDPDLWDRVFRVNVRSTFLMSKYAVPHLKASAGGSIVNMSSMAGLRGAPGLAAYSASKAAINGFTVSLALELARSRIRVNAICPGWVDTPFNKPVIDFLGGPVATQEAVQAGTPLGRQGTVQEIAALVLYLACDESAFMTAQAISINGGAHN